MTSKCANGHEQKWKCHTGVPAACSKCERAKKEAAKKAQAELDAQKARDQQLQNYQSQLSRLNEEYRRLTLSNADKRVQEQQQNVLEQRKKDIENARALLQQTPFKMPSSGASTPTVNGELDGNLESATSTIKNNNNQRIAAQGPTINDAEPQTQKANTLKSLQSHIKSVMKHRMAKTERPGERSQSRHR
jgi:DNA repair exonuclease SbcCD ATPase subunit